MRYTLAEVLDGYTVIYDHDTYMSYVWPDLDDEESAGIEVVRIYGGEGRIEFNADANQTVNADGDYFTIKDEDGKEWQFQAYKVVRLNEVPELR